MVRQTHHKNPTLEEINYFEKFTIYIHLEKSQLHGKIRSSSEFCICSQNLYRDADFGEGVGG